MSFKSLRIRARARFGLLSLATAILLWPAASLAAPDPDRIAVYVDQAKLVKLPAKVATIVVGNPLIADVTLQSGGIIVVTGKGYGATNFIAMDRNGEVLVDRQIQVEGPTDQLVTVYRGVERESYSCVPVCQRRITLGDGSHLFQAGDRSGRLALKPGQRCRGSRGVQRRQLSSLQPGGRPHMAAASVLIPKMVKIRLTEWAVLAGSGETLQQSVSGNSLAAIPLAS